MGWMGREGDVGSAMRAAMRGGKDSERRIASAPASPGPAPPRRVLPALFVSRFVLELEEIVRAAGLQPCKSELPLRIAS